MRAEVRAALDDLHRDLVALYGGRLKRVILYGSHARGEAGPHSDIDVLVVLGGPLNVWEELKRTGDARTDHSLDAGIDLQVAFASEDDFAAGKTNMLRNVWREGIDIEKLDTVTDTSAPPEVRIGDTPSVVLEDVDKRPEQLWWLRRARDELGAARLAQEKGYGHLLQHAVHEGLLALARVLVLRAGSDELKGSRLPEVLCGVAAVDGTVPEGLCDCVRQAHALWLEHEWEPTDPPPDRAEELLARAEGFLAVAEQSVGPEPEETPADRE